MSSPATSRIRRRIETLACTICLATAAHAQRQPLHDGALIRPIRSNGEATAEEQKFAVSDLSPPFPQYTSGASNDLQLPRDRRAPIVGAQHDKRDSTAEQLYTSEAVTHFDHVEKGISHTCEAIPEANMIPDVSDAQNAIDEVHEDAHSFLTEATSSGGQEIDDSAVHSQLEKHDNGIHSDTEEGVPTAPSLSEPIAHDGLLQTGSHPSLVVSKDQDPLREGSSEEESQLRDDHDQGQRTENTFIDYNHVPSAGDALTDVTSIADHYEFLENIVDSIHEEDQLKLVVREINEKTTSSSSTDSDAIVTLTTVEVGRGDVHEDTAEPIAEIADTMPPREDDDHDAGTTATAEEVELASEDRVHPNKVSSEIHGNFREDDSGEHLTSRTGDRFTQTHDKINIVFDESPPLSSLPYKDQDANREFVIGLDEIDKFFESVSPPDELDVGADGSSIQEVLVGQGLKIIFKRAKSFGSSVKKRFEKIVEKALPQQWMILTEDHDEEEDSLEDIFKLLKSDVPLKVVNDIDGERKAQKDSMDDNAESSNDKSHNKLHDRFPLLKTKQAHKLWKYARRKWEQAKHLFDEFFAIFEGHGDDDDDDDDIDFYSELSRMNYDDMRSLIEQNSLARKEDNIRPQFGMEVDDLFVRSRYDAMMKLREKNIQVESGAKNKG